MRQQNQFRSFSAEQFNGWEALSDPGVVRDPNFSVNFLSRNIEIDAHQDAAAFDVKVANG
jgi:hypothetical protein